MSDRPDLYLAVQAALTDDERTKFLDRWLDLNPHFRGCDVADVLAILDDSDSHLEITEPLWESLDGLADDDRRVRCLCAIALWYVDGVYRTPASRDEIETLAARVEVPA